MAIAGGVGASLMPEDEQSHVAWCFSESASRIVVTVPPEKLSEVLTAAADAKVVARDCGTTGGTRLIVNGVFDVAVSDLATTWRSAVPLALGVNE